MKDAGKIEIVLSWDDDNYCCKFMRNGETDDWNDMSRDEQVRSVGAMVTMAKLFEKFIKEDDNG